MTYKQFIIRHWFKIGIAAIGIPLASIFDFVNSSTELASGVPYKYVFALIACLGVYTLAQVDKGIKIMVRRNSGSAPVLRAKQVVVREPVQEAEDADVFSQFGGQT